MAVVSRVALLRFTNATATSTRAWTATAAVQDSAAGVSVVVTTAQATTGTLFAAVADTLTLNLYNDSGGLIRAFALDATSLSQTSTFFFTDTGATGGAARSGTVEIAIRATKTTGLGTETYDYETDGSPATPPSTHTAATDRGWVRGTTTGALSASNVGFGGATPALFAYPDTIFQRLTIGAASYVARTFTLTTGSRSGASSSSVGVTFDRNQGAVDNTLPVAVTVHAQTATPANATLTGLPFTVLTTLTAPTVTTDPRITFTHLKQENSNSFATPPGAGDTGLVHLADNLGFLNARTTAATGTGLNAITWTATLQDAAALVTPLTRSVTSATQGGELGWGSAFLAWPDTKPPGIWNKTNTITAPANAVGLGTSTTAAYTMVATNPNLRMVCGAGPAGLGIDSRHFVAGDPLLIGLAVFDTSALATVTLDATPVPAVALGRFNLALGRAEYLAADGITWTATNGATVYFHPLTVSAGDSRVWTLTLTGVQTAGWGFPDVYVVGRASVAGVPASGFQKEVAVGGFNKHDDATGGGAGVTPAEIAAIANAVWDELTAEGRTAGSYGQLVKDRIDVAVSTRATPADVTVTVQSEPQVGVR